MIEFWDICSAAFQKYSLWVFELQFYNNVYGISQHCSTIQPACFCGDIFNRYGGIPAEAKTRAFPSVFQATAWVGSTSASLAAASKNKKAFPQCSVLQQLHFIQCPFPNQIQFGLGGKDIPSKRQTVPNQIQFSLENYCVNFGGQKFQIKSSLVLKKNLNCKKIKISNQFQLVEMNWLSCVLLKRL